MERMAGLLVHARGTLVSAWSWLERHPVKGLVGALVMSALLRAPFLGRPLSFDEGGFLMVARQWDGAGSALYGDQWVDRPPLLLLIFKAADWLGGSAVTLRLFALVFAAVMIVSAWWAGKVINGPKGAVAAAFVAAMVGANVSLDGVGLTGETMAGAFVMLSCALTLQARYDAKTPQTGVLLALFAGVVAALACLVKQSFIDAGVFALVLLGLKLHKTWRLLVAGTIGVAIPLFVTTVWARSDEGPGLVRLWTAVVRFRQRAYAVVEDTTSTAPVEHPDLLLLLFVVAGMAFLGAQMLVAVLSVHARRSLRVAVVVMLAYGVAGVLLGGSWWRHYLLQLVPVLALGTAIATQRSAQRFRSHAATTYAVAASVVTAIVAAATHLNVTSGDLSDEAVADYLKAASEPTDSVIVAYGSPSIIQRSGLTTPYRYSWSLPIRGRDPHLTQLVATLEGPQAPTWLIEMGSFDWWQLDTPDFQEVRRARYHWVADVCGHNVYLRNDLPRDLPPSPVCAGY
jgi:hypothetical protein